MFELKSLPKSEAASALVIAEHCREVGEPEAAESMCLDVLAVEPDDQRALVLLLLARTDLLERGLPGSVERARESLPRLSSAFERAYYAGLICERHGRYLLHSRGRRSSFLAWEMFREALEHFEEAARIAPERVEPMLRFNSCVRLVEQNRHCVPPPDDGEEHGIE